jgi:hypothetical protein
MKILDLKSTITKLANLLEGFIIGLEQEEKNVLKLERDDPRWQLGCRPKSVSSVTPKSC